MTYDPHGQYGSDPRYGQGQNPQYPQYQQYPQDPQYQQNPQYPSTNPYPQNPGYASPDPYAQPGASDPTAPVVPSYGGGNNPYSGGGSYGGNDPYSGNQYSGGGAYGQSYGQQQYGADPYSAPPSSGWPAPPGSVPPGGVPPRKPRTGLIVGLAAGGVALVLCLGGLAVAGTRLLDEDDPADPPATNVADPGNPSADPPNANPFADTPAANFASGAEGIELPEPTAVGEFSAEQVSDMLDQVREALIATRLDEAMLFDHNPDPFIDAMAQDNQEGLRGAFDDGEFGYFATQIADGAELAVPEPRVDGTMTFEATVDEGGFNVIEVVTKFVWAYAFVLPSDDPDLDGIVVVRDELVWQVADPGEVNDSSQGLWLWDGEGYASGIDCEQFEQSLLAPQTELSFGGGEGPDEGEVYDPEGSLDLPDTC
jgi:hypothetical protein